MLPVLEKQPVKLSISPKYGCSPHKIHFIKDNICLEQNVWGTSKH